MTFGEFINYTASMFNALREMRAMRNLSVHSRLHFNYANVITRILFLPLSLFYLTNYGMKSNSLEEKVCGMSPLRE